MLIQIKVCLTINQPKLSKMKKQEINYLTSLRQTFLLTQLQQVFLTNLKNKQLNLQLAIYLVNLNNKHPSSQQPIYLVSLIRPNLNNSKKEFSEATKLKPLYSSAISLKTKQSQIPTLSPSSQQNKPKSQHNKTAKTALRNQMNLNNCYKTKWSKEIHLCKNMIKLTRASLTCQSLNKVEPGL
jgi:hypothetical protein